MIGNSAIREITRLCSNLKYFSLEGCKCSRKVIEKLDRNIEVEWFGTESDWSDTGSEN
ncbi:7201_t:CDS:1, partial [Funneliformis geosporum]